VESVIPHIDRIGQVLLSCLSGIAPPSCKLVASVGVSKLLAIVKQEGEGGELRPKVVDLMPRVTPLLLSVTRDVSSSRLQVSGVMPRMEEWI